MKSSHSNPKGNCIDVDKFGQIIVLTETDDLNRSIYTTEANFKAFIEGVKAGEFDHFAEDKDARDTIA